MLLHLWTFCTVICCMHNLCCLIPHTVIIFEIKMVLIVIVILILITIIIIIITLCRKNSLKNFFKRNPSRQDKWEIWRLQIICESNLLSPFLHTLNNLLQKLLSLKPLCFQHTLFFSCHLSGPTDTWLRKINLLFLRIKTTVNVWASVPFVILCDRERSHVMEQG